MLNMSNAFESVYSFRMRTIYTEVLLQNDFSQQYYLNVKYHMFNEWIDAWYLWLAPVVGSHRQITG